MGIRPKRATDRIVRVDASRPVFAAQGPPVRLPDSPLRVVLSWLPGLLFLGVLIVVLGYLALSSTIMGFLTVADHRAVVVRGAYPIGQVPPGEYVFISAQEPARDLGGRFGEAVRGVPSPAVVMVIGTPGDHVRSDDGGVIHVNGNATRFNGTVKERVLTEEYLAACISGVCGRAGDEVVFPQDHVLGKVTGWVGGAPSGYRSTS